jgi:WD40 repeat protein/class 3 adenylate cyclase
VSDVTALTESVERTFLITDIRGYTRFTREQGNAEAARLARRFAELSGDAVEARGGRVVEVRGDEVLAVFPAAAQAVRAAVELAATCAEESELDASLPLLPGMGVDIGEAVPVGEGFRGAVLNTAARLCSRAAGGQVLVSAAVAESTGLGVRFESVGTAELKGFDNPVELFEAAADAAPQTYLALGDEVAEPLPVELETEASFVGRDRELSWLRGAWREARRGRGRVMFVSGPPRSGKTRLAAELCAQALGGGACVEYAGAGGTGAARARAALERVIAAGRPTILVLDDLDVLGESVAEQVNELFEAFESAPVLVVGITASPDASSSVAELVARADTRGDGHRTLGALEPAEIREIVALYAGADVDDAPLESISRASGGLPGAVYELTSEWADQEATRRLAAAAEWLAEGRTTRRADLEFANNVIGLKLVRFYGDEAPDGTTKPGECPYKGLASFEQLDAQLFFGRERLVGELAARTVASGLLAVVGPSGIGKSSLIAAGLLPSIRAGLLPGSGNWQIAVIRPGEHPSAELATVDRIRSDERLVLVVDQFEEVFTTCEDAGERDDFLTALTDRAGDPEASVVVLSMRGDFIDHCAGYPQLAELVSANQVLVGPMRQEELRQVIERPARRAGLRVEATLVDALVAEIADEPGGLPLLSTALVELWQHRTGAWLRMETYERTGGVRGAVARLAESAFEHLDTPEREVTRSIFMRLVTTGEGDVLMRRRVPLAEFDPDRDLVAAEVLTRLTDDRLLTRSDASIEVAHEALLREWPRLQGWLEEDAQGRHLRQHLTQAATQWADGGRDPSELYRGARLSATIEWAALHGRELNELEREFLAASRAAGERDLQRQRRINRRLRGLLIGVGALLLAAIAAGVLALVQRAHAQTKARVALAQSLGAQAVSEPHLDRAMLLAREAASLDPSVQTSSDLLTTLLRTPTVLRTFHSDANRNLDIALSPNGRTIAIEDNNGNVVVEDALTGSRIGRLRADIQGFGPDGSLLTASGGTLTGRRSVIEVRDPTTLKVTRTIPFPRSLRGRDVAVSGVVFGPAGTRTAVELTRSHPSPAGPEATWAGILQYDYETGRLIGPPIRVPNDAGLVGYSTGGRSLVLVRPNAVDVLDSRTGHRVRAYPVSGGAAALSPDGKTVAIGSDDGSVRFLDVATGKVVLGVGAQGGGVAVLGFTPDGKTLITSGQDGETLLWDVETHTIRQTLAGHAGPIHAQAISADGSTLYTGSFDTNVLSWDLTGRRGVIPSFVAATTDPSGGYWSLAISPDSKTVAVGSTNGDVNIWELATKRRIETFHGAPGAVAALAFGPGGRTLLVAADVGDPHNPTHASLRIWKLGPHPQLLRSLHGGERQFQSVYWATWSGDGRTIAASGLGPHQDSTKAGLVAEWNAATGALLARPTVVVGGDAPYVSFAPHGTTVAIGQENGGVQILDPARRKVTRRFSPGGLYTFGTVFSPDGSKVATGDWDGSIDIWSARSGKRIGARIPDPGQTDVLSTAWSPDGRTIAITDAGSALRLFDVASRQEIGPPIQLSPGQENPYVAFTPDGSRVIVTDQTGRLWIFPITVTSWEHEACRIANRNFTRAEWSALLPGQPYRQTCSR